MEAGLVIGIDSSTTGCKAIAWDAAGRPVAQGRAAYALLQPHPTWFEQDAACWWQGLCSAVRELLERIDRRRVQALCIACQRESFVPVDGAGEPLRHALLWLDERSRHQLDYLDREIGGQKLHRISGKPLSMIPSLPKIVWLQQNEPDVVAATDKFLDTHAYLVHRLTGQYVTSLASADPMGLIDMTGRRWANAILQTIGLRAGQFCELVEPGKIIGGVTRRAAETTGLPEGLPVVAGAGDGQCAGLGTNSVTDERFYLNMGTAVVSGAFSRDYRTNPSFRTLYAPVPGAFYLETCLKGGAYTVGWFVRHFARDLLGADSGWSPEQILETAATAVPPGCLGLMLVPYWHNVLNPYWDPAASGITLGWTGAHGREHFYRAILEGVAFEQRLAGEGLVSALGAASNAAPGGHTLREYAVIGGGSRSDLWCQIMADVTGVEVVRGQAEATCLGAGILAAVAAGMHSDILSAAWAMTATGARFEPDTERHAFYSMLYSDVYKPLFPTLRPLIDRLTELTHDKDTPG